MSWSKPDHSYPTPSYVLNTACGAKIPGKESNLVKKLNSRTSTVQIIQKTEKGIPRLNSIRNLSQET